MNRRRILLTLSFAALGWPGDRLMRGQRARAATQGGVDVDAILDDPETPVVGNPQGDVPIVAFIDYNCPFCKRSDPDLRRLARRRPRNQTHLQGLADPRGHIGVCRKASACREVSAKI